MQFTSYKNCSSKVDFSLSFHVCISAKGKQAGVISTMIQCSAQTSAKRLQAQIVLRLIKKSRTSLGAPKGRRVSMENYNLPYSQFCLLFAV